MKLKPQIEPCRFFERIRLCKNEVWFETTEGDRLNLKSTLSQYIFTAAWMDNISSLNGDLVCASPADYDLLWEFLSP